MATRIRQSTAGPSRHRESTAGPSAAGSSQRQPSTALPPYETPAFPLNPAAQRALDNLIRAHSLKKLDDSLIEAQQTLQEAATAINDRVTERERRVKKRKTPGDGTTPENEGAAERSLEELRDKVERMTQRMDESMRKMIDGQHSVESIKTSIDATAARARADGSTQASTQRAGTQRARRRRQAGEGGEGEDEDEEDEEYQDFTPTDPRGGTQPQTTAIETFRAKLEDSKTRYQSHSLTARYAENNSYRDFKRLVHDAKHPDDGVQLAHHSEWFEEGQAPAPGVTTRARQAADDEDGSDDDLAVSRMTISTKCPLTLQEFKKPLTSKKCPHSFESEAILGLLSGSNQRQNGRSGEKMVQCPVSGCSQMLTRPDLHTDAVLIRQIGRLQRSKALEAEDEEQDRNEGGATVIDDGDDDAADVDDIVEGRTQIKGEPKGTGRRAAPRGTQSVVEVETDPEPEEDDDGDETMEE